PAATFEHNLNQQRAADPLWPYLLLAAAILLPVDVAVRRLVLTRRDIDQAISRVTARQAAEPVAGSSHLGQLLDVKDRARPADSPAATPPPAPERPAGGEPVTANPRRVRRPTTISQPPAPKPKAMEK